MKKIITVRRDGTMSFIYEDKLRGLLNHGRAMIKRASDVEPGDPTAGQDPLKWYANMARSRGGMLGPFDTRELALTAEVDWINANVLTQPTVAHA